MTDAQAELRPFNVQQLFQRWTDELTRVDQEPNIALIAAIESIAERDGWSLTEYAQARMVPASKRGGLTAASRGFNPDMHPRGHDGKFIVKFGFVNVLLNALQQDESSKTKFSPTGAKKNQRGRVVDIIPDPKNPGDPDIRVEVMDSNGKQLGFATVKSDSITAAEPIKARLDLDEPVLPDESMPDMPEDVMPGGLPPEVAMPGDPDTVSTPIDAPDTEAPKFDMRQGEPYDSAVRMAGIEGKFVNRMDLPAAQEGETGPELWKRHLAGPAADAGGGDTSVDEPGSLVDDLGESYAMLERNAPDFNDDLFKQVQDYVENDDREGLKGLLDEVLSGDDSEATGKVANRLDLLDEMRATLIEKPDKAPPKSGLKFEYWNSKGLDDWGKESMTKLSDEDLDLAIEDAKAGKGLSPSVDLKNLEAEKASRAGGELPDPTVDMAEFDKTFPDPEKADREKRLSDNISAVMSGDMDRPQEADTDSAEIATDSIVSEINSDVPNWTEADVADAVDRYIENSDQDWSSELQQQVMEDAINELDVERSSGLQWDEASNLWRLPDGTEASFDDVENAGYDGTLRSGPPDDAPRYKAGMVVDTSIPNSGSPEEADARRQRDEEVLAQSKPFDQLKKGDMVLVKDNGYDGKPITAQVTTANTPDFMGSPRVELKFMPDEDLGESNAWNDYGAYGADEIYAPGDTIASPKTPAADNEPSAPSMSGISSEQIESQTRIDLQYQAQNEAANIEGEWDQTEERDAFVDALRSIDSATVGGRANEVWDALDDAREKRDFFVDSLENEDDAQMITDDFAFLDEMANAIERDYPGETPDASAPATPAADSNSEWGPATSMRDRRTKLEAAGATWNSNLQQFELPDGTKISVDQDFSNNTERFSVFPPGTSMWTTDQSKVKRFSNLDDALASIPDDDEVPRGAKLPPVFNGGSTEWDGGNIVQWNAETGKFVEADGYELTADEVEEYGLDPGGRFGPPPGMKTYGGAEPTSDTDSAAKRAAQGGEPEKAPTPPWKEPGAEPGATDRPWENLTDDQLKKMLADFSPESIQQNSPLVKEVLAEVARRTGGDQSGSNRTATAGDTGGGIDVTSPGAGQVDVNGPSRDAVRSWMIANYDPDEAAVDDLLDNVGKESDSGFSINLDAVNPDALVTAKSSDTPDAGGDFLPRNWGKAWKSAGELDEYLAGLTPEQKMIDIDNAAKDPRSMKVLPARLKKMKDDDLWAMFDTVDGADFGSTDGDSDGLREVKIEMARRKLVRFKGKGPKATKDAASVPSSGGPADKSWIPTAKSGDKVPISELPVGAEVIMGGQWRKVGAPILLDGGDPKNPDDYRFKYWDGVQWDWVQPDTQFTVGSMPAGKKLHSMGRKYHEAAAAAGGDSSPKAPAAPKAAAKPSSSSGKFAQSSQAAQNAYEAVLAGKIKPQMVMNTGTPAKGKVVAQGKGASYTFIKAPSTGEWYLTYGDSFGGVSGVPAGPGDMNTPSGIKVTDLDIIDALDAVAVL